jgi:hypothetical protein
MVPDFCYPISVTEHRNRKHKDWFGHILYSQREFLTFGRVPTRGTFVQGEIFDSSGRFFNYRGERGFPRFQRQTKTVLEALILPGALFYLSQLLVYYGPDVKDETLLDLDDFKARLLAVWSKGSMKSEREELAGIVKSAKDYRMAIERVNHWRYFGGRRDEDGHPIEDADQPNS